MSRSSSSATALRVPPHVGEHVQHDRALLRAERAHGVGGEGSDDVELVSDDGGGSLAGEDPGEPGTKGLATSSRCSKRCLAYAYRKSPSLGSRRSNDSGAMGSGVPAAAMVPSAARNRLQPSISWKMR